MKIHASNFLMGTVTLRNESVGVYVTLASYASKYGELDAVIPWGFVSGWLPDYRVRKRIRADLEKHGLVEVQEDKSWRLREVRRTARWVYLGNPDSHTQAPLAAIRPLGYSDDRPKRDAITPQLRAQIIERDEMVCGICSLLVEDYNDLHIDHIRPVSLGGTNDPENLQVAHARCNLSKGARV